VKTVIFANSFHRSIIKVNTVAKAYDHLLTLSVLKKDFTARRSEIGLIVLAIKGQDFYELHVVSISIRTFIFNLTTQRIHKWA